MISEEDELCQALTSSQIKKANAEEIKQVIRYAIMKVGLRAQNWPSDEEKCLLISHIIKEYGNHTVDEIKLAFDMAIVGKLELQKNESVNCFENFSCLYFSSIMNAYRSWASQIVKFKQQVRVPLKELPPPEMGDDEIIENALGVWNATKRFEFISESSYEALVRAGKIVLTNEEKKKLMDAAIPSLVDMEARDPAVFKHSSRKDFQKLFAKKLAVRNYFQTI